MDAAQLVPHRPFDMAALDVDYVAFSGHKLYAPFGAGCLVGRADWLRAAEPYLLGGGATAGVDAAQVRWSADPQQRHEAGTPNVLGVVALAAACEALTDWDTLVASEERLLKRLRDGLAAIPGVRELSLWGEPSPRVGIVSFVVEGRELTCGRRRAVRPVRHRRARREVLRTSVPAAAARRGVRRL